MTDQMGGTLGRWHAIAFGAVGGGVAGLAQLASHLVFLGFTQTTAAHWISRLGGPPSRQGF